MLAISTDEARPESWVQSEIEWVAGLRSERGRERREWKWKWRPLVPRGL
jgi:hypothetical protein